MRINDLVKPETLTIKALRDQFNSGELFVDDSFQRRYVWLRKNQVKLIETILTGYIIPEIYLWDQDTDPDTGVIKRSIVDGQQRIRSIVDYINGDYSLTKSFLDNSEATYAGKAFAELESEDKKLIWDYTLSIKRILSNVEREEVVNIFLRLNSTDKSLNPQELRHAEYNGLFLQTALDIANNEFWSKYKVFTVDTLRRMQDVEFISSILMFLRGGIKSELTQKSINQAYDLYNEVYEEKEADKCIFNSILSEIERCVSKDESNVLIKYISKTTHLYTFIVSLYCYVSVGKALDEEEIRNWINFYTYFDQSKDVIAQEYKGLLVEGTRSKNNRMRRMIIMQEVLAGKHHLD